MVVSLTCQGYSPISVSTPPTILVLVKALGIPHAADTLLFVYNTFQLTAGARLVARVDAHLGMVHGWTIAATVVPVTSSGHVHSVLVDQGGAPGLRIAIYGGARSVLHPHEREREDTVAAGGVAGAASAARGCGCCSCDR